VVAEPLARWQPALARTLVLVVTALPLSCGRSARSSGGDSSHRDGGGTTADRGGSGGASGTGIGGTGASEGGVGGEPDPACTPESPPESPLRHLNRFEYNNTVRDLFGDATRPADALAPELDIPGVFATARIVEGYHELAHDFAQRVTTDDAATIAFIGCDPSSDGEGTCRRDFIQDFVARVFRRPPTASDVDEFSSVFANGQTLGQNFRSGVRAVVEVALQAPEFLYRPELGEPAEDRGPGWARPSPYEMASRLSYLFWGSAPDAELLNAARGDALRTQQEIEEQARRLLGDARARDVVGFFYLRLLRLAGATFPASGDAQYPSFTPEIAKLLPQETEAFTADVTLSGQGDFAALLTAPHTFVNGPLAAFYGLSGVSGDEFERIDLDPSRRGGLLTHASFLASAASGPYSNPSRRGTLLANAFLCLAIPTKPPNLPPPEPPSPDATTRHNLEWATSDAVCAGCHAIFDPLGFAFEHYDAAGLWRDTENGLAIDATGELVETDAAGAFDGAVGLLRRIAASDDARRCFVQNWFAYAQARNPTNGDACSLETLERAFMDANLNLRELLVALSQNDAFLYRAEVTP
jgi:hypothetical protein